MAKTQSGASGENREGMPTGFRSGKVSRKAANAQLIPWTSGPTTRAQRIARSLWG